MDCRILKIALDTPLDTEFDYRWRKTNEVEPLPEVGQFALVPFGRREVVGLIVAVQEASSYAAEKIRDVIAVRSQLSPLSPQWFALCRFAADYYQRPLGEVVIPCNPKNLRAIKQLALDKAVKKSVLFISCA